MNFATIHTLRQLLADMTGDRPVPAVAIGGISSDSRKLAPADAFLACQGLTHHGLEFLDQAVAARAAAVVWDSSTGSDPGEVPGLVTVPVEDLAERLGIIANRWFGKPSAHLKVSGVTGTNGKTTVAWLIAECMGRLESRCAYLGTLGAGTRKLEHDLDLTTPCCIDLHRKLAGFQADHATHAALEVSSHALGQRRVDGVSFDTVLFTNLSRDHIDYHGNMHAYGEAKAAHILRRDVRHRIVNTDSPFGRELAGRCDGDVVAVSTRPGSDVRRPPYVCMRATKADEDGSTVEVDSSWGKGQLHVPLAGHFNVSNAGLVLAQLLCWGIPLDEAASVLGSVEAPPGRMQRVNVAGAGPLPAVYVDFAHTPAGLEAALVALRSHCNGRLWCVFGCGGDRDRGKRAPMGETASRVADRTVVTNDNPRSEPPEEIIDAIVGGMAGEPVVIPDRAAAIAHAIDNAEDDDVILIAGKGHEEFQAIGNERIPFSDCDQAQAALAARGRARSR
jgi:UDP-N-acetylmuramoyl-L-alanyl-D-glutamate--2,6-diaminopimelate ligase